MACGAVTGAERHYGVQVIVRAAAVLRCVSEETAVGSGDAERELAW